MLHEAQKDCRDNNSDRAQFNSTSFAPAGSKTNTILCAKLLVNQSDLTGLFPFYVIFCSPCFLAAEGSEILPTWSWKWFHSHWLHWETLCTKESAPLTSSSLLWTWSDNRTGNHRNAFDCIYCVSFDSIIRSTPHHYAVSKFFQIFYVKHTWGLLVFL